MKCNKCGADNLENSSFCKECGISLKNIQNEEIEKNISMEKTDDDNKKVFLK